MTKHLHLNAVLSLTGLATLLLVACPAVAKGGAATKPSQQDSSGAPSTPEDPYLWLEDVTGERALGWVREQNAVSTRELESSPEFGPIRQRLLTILDSKERIPYVGKHGAWYYNFWRDEKNPRGLWRRTTLAEFKKAEPAWEIVLDLDKVTAAEKENWVWKGYAMLYPTYDRCLMFLSRGGADATVVREFDLKAKEFVKDGFYLPEAKSHMDWRSREHKPEGYFPAGAGFRSAVPDVVLHRVVDPFEALGRQDFDAVFTDLGMPEVNGWDLAQQAKAHTSAPTVVLVTGWGFQLEEDAAAARGVDFVMAKPFSWDDVVAVVRQVGVSTARAA